MTIDINDNMNRVYHDENMTHNDAIINMTTLIDTIYLKYLDDCSSYVNGVMMNFNVADQLKILKFVNSNKIDDDKSLANEQALIDLNRHFKVNLLIFK